MEKQEYVSGVLGYWRDANLKQQFEEDDGYKFRDGLGMCPA